MASMNISMKSVEKMLSFLFLEQNVDRIVW